MSRLPASLVLVAALTSCTPEYPLCRNDTHCRIAESCANGRCVQCADDSQCLAGEKCMEGACGIVLDKCASNGDCAEGQVCLLELCSKCFEDVQCGEGRLCVDGRCSECGGDDDCAGGGGCVDGACTDMVVEPKDVVLPEGCLLEPVYFAFDSAELTKASLATLDGWVECLDPERTYTLIGRADAVGDEGYNLSLGLDRAKAVKDHLVSRGVKSTLVVATAGMHIAEGKDNDKDRRVDIL